MSITDRRWMCWYFLTGWLPICGPGCSGPPDPAGGATEPAGGATSTDAAPPDLPSPTPTPTTGDGTTGDTTTTGALATTGV